MIKVAMAGALFCGAAASAQTFTYNTGDLLASFRKSGSPDLIVDLGSVSLYQNASAPIAISGVDSTLFTTVFGGLDGISWSVFGYVNTSGSSLGSQYTIWVTAPRSDITVANDPNASETFSSQRQAVNKMRAIVDGATSSLYGETVLADQIVEIPSALNVGGDPVSYTVGVGTYGDFNGTWAPSVENLTATGFAASSTPSVSDLFQQTPKASVQSDDIPGSYLGDFQLSNAGTLAFNPVPEPSFLAMIGAGMMTLVAVLRFGRKNNSTL